MNNKCFNYIKKITVFLLLLGLTACSVSSVDTDSPAQASNEAANTSYNIDSSKTPLTESTTVPIPENKKDSSSETDNFTGEDASNVDTSNEEASDEALTQSAKNAILYDFSSKELLFSKNADEKCYPASITKLLTACVALKFMDINTVIEVGDEALLVQPHSSLCYVQPGHRLTLYDLLAGLLVTSGNDAAYVIAVNCARAVYGDSSLSNEKSIMYFTSMMNAYARSIGALNSNFVNPDGWHNDEHYTTANDIMLITLEALKFREIKEICAIKETIITFESGETIKWTNSNYLLHQDIGYYYQYATGLKTGSTNPAGKCLVAMAEKNGRELITIVMGCEDDAKRYGEAISLFEYGFS